MTHQQTILVPFLGDGAYRWNEGGKDTVLTVTHIADGYVRGVDGTCAYCHGDPCAEDSPATSLIAKFYAHNGSWAETCPCCSGRPT